MSKELGRLRDQSATSESSAHSEVIRWRCSYRRDSEGSLRDRRVSAQGKGRLSMNFRKGSSAHAIACFVSVGLLLFLLARCGGGEQQVVRRPPPDTLTLVSKSSLFPPGCDN